MYDLTYSWNDMLFDKIKLTDYSFDFGSKNQQEIFRWKMSAFYILSNSFSNHIPKHVFALNGRQDIISHYFNQT